MTMLLTANIAAVASVCTALVAMGSGGGRIAVDGRQRGGTVDTTVVEAAEADGSKQQAAASHLRQREARDWRLLMTADWDCEVEEKQWLPV